MSIWHGIQQLIEPQEASNYLVAYVVLAIAFVLEGASFSVTNYVLNTSNPTLRAVFAEDAAALIGITIAAI